MTDQPRQLVFDLPVRSALGAEDFLVTSSNLHAVEMIDAWPNWPAPALLVCGSAGVGKTHLASVWQSRSDAVATDYAALDDAAVDRFSRTGAMTIEGIGPGGPERLMFHLLNLAREHGGSVLITSRLAAGDLDIALPDLRSRLRALPSAVIGEPDDALLQGLLVKLFADRQLIVEPGIVTYLLRNMERSAEAAALIVAAIDHAALQHRRRVTRPLVAGVLQELEPNPRPPD